MGRSREMSVVCLQPFVPIRVARVNEQKIMNRQTTRTIAIFVIRPHIVVTPFICFFINFFQFN